MDEMTVKTGHIEHAIEPEMQLARSSRSLYTDVGACGRSTADPRHGRKPMVVIFDLDDTLTDTMASLSVARDKVIRHFGHTPTTAALERWQHASHFFDPEDFPHVLPLVMPGLAGRQIDVDEIRQPYWAWEIDNLTLKAGAADVLLGLAARGIEMALVTNGPRAKQERKVQRLALETYMSRGAVVYADGVHVSLEREALDL